ncbi:kinase-like domain-containing protein [Suillus subaureus]|uniref:Kinase-like domain-containing protein n=1 Tax=Suillus subaureus TaxID=48587 RepID=A0A9P7DWQ9_9AGAM|nr:kinase-like domain-containing protein [Suillus subaureus]KAG1805189.1 kinase-like domain-containing protein [Suillus subaureus]
MISRSRQPTAAAKKLALIPVLTLEGHKDYMSSISYFPDGKRMISGSSDKTTRQWDLEAGKEIEEARDVYDQDVHAVGISRDGRYVVTAASGGDGSEELKVCETGTIVRTFEGHSRKINCIDISRDSTLLASGAEDKTARIWSLETGKLVAGPFQSIYLVGAVRFSKDSKKLAVKSRWGKYLEVWDVQTQKLDVKVGTFGGAHFSCTPVFWTPKDKTIVTAFSFQYSSSPNTIYEFDASTLETVRAPFAGHTHHHRASDDNTIKLWAFESRQLLASFNVMYPHCLILSPDSCQLVYTTRRNNNIYLCNILPETLANIQPVPQVRVSALRNLPFADCDAFSFTTNQSTSEAPQNAQWSLPSYSLPASPWPTLLPPPQIPSPTIGPRHLPPNPCELLPSTSNTVPVLPIRNDDPSDLSETIFQDLSIYITKDGEYPVARGGFGEVWKCTYHIDRGSVKVAVKALQVYAADQLGAAKTKKIKRELRICASLKHPNILPVYGYTYGFGPFLAIVSPWAENGNLSEYLGLGGAALTLVGRFQILRDIIAGLRYLHANRVIHGDLNGPNVLVNGDGTACVADFGLSLMYSEVISASRASWTSTLKGNVRWMAPELLGADMEDGSPGRPSEQSDIFSFGGIMHTQCICTPPIYQLYIWLPGGDDPTLLESERARYCRCSAAI